MRGISVFLIPALIVWGLGIRGADAADAKIVATGFVRVSTATFDCLTTGTVALVARGENFAFVSGELAQTPCRVTIADVLSNIPPSPPDPGCQIHVDTYAPLVTDLSVSGNVYTVTGSYTYCSGDSLTIRAVLDVGDAIGYTLDRTFSNPAFDDVHVTGTLRRIA